MPESSVYRESEEMRTDKEILTDEQMLIKFNTPNNPLLLEVLLDIRGLLSDLSVGDHHK